MPSVRFLIRLLKVFPLDSEVVLEFHQGKDPVADIVSRDLVSVRSLKNLVILSDDIEHNVGSES